MSLLSGVYARGSKRSHTGGKCVTCSGLTNFCWNLKRPAKGPVQYLGERRERKRVQSSLSTVSLYYYYKEESSRLTLLHCASPTGLCESVALAHRAAEAHVHEALSVWRQRSSSRQHQSHPPSQNVPDLLEDQSTTTQSTECQTILVT